MPRAIWRGAISFGMVSIPVRLFTATDSKDIAFRQLASEDLGRVKMMRWSPTLDREVSFDELVKGYEYAKDQYVIVDQGGLRYPPGGVEAHDRDRGVRQGRGNRPGLLRAHLRSRA